MGDGQFRSGKADNDRSSHPPHHEALAGSPSSPEPHLLGTVSPIACHNDAVEPKSQLLPDPGTDHIHEQWHTFPLNVPEHQSNLASQLHYAPEFLEREIEVNKVSVQTSLSFRCALSCAIKACD